MLRFVAVSVADPECFSRIQDPHFDSIRIPDPKIPAKDSCQKKMVSKTIFVVTNLPKLRSYFIFYMVKKKISHNFSRIIEFFTQIVTEPSKSLLYP
jgi:hypothetical protein